VRRTAREERNYNDKGPDDHKPARGSLTYGTSLWSEGATEAMGKCASIGRCREAGNDLNII